MSFINVRLEKDEQNMSVKIAMYTGFITPHKISNEYDTKPVQGCTAYQIYANISTNPHIFSEDCARSFMMDNHHDKKHEVMLQTKTYQ